MLFRSLRGRRLLPKLLRVIIGSLPIALMAVLVGPAALPPSSASISGAFNTSDALAFSVEVAGASALENAAVGVVVSPSEERLTSVADGESFTQWSVPASAVRASGSRIEVVLDPAEVPDANVTGIGLVSFTVIIADAERRLMTTTATTVRRVTVGDDLVWAEPMTSVSEPTGAAARQTHGAPEVRAADLGPSVSSDDEVARELRENLPRLSATLRATSLAAARAAAIEPTLMVRCNKVTSKRVWATVGTSYPLGDDHKSRLTYSSSTASTFGRAVTAPGQGWDESGSRTVGDDWGVGFKNTHWKRSYRIEVEYEKRRCVIYDGTWVYDEWVPHVETGGATTNYLPTYPDWGNCVRVLGGAEWYHGHTDSKDYSLSYGVKFQEVLGFDMTSTRAYQTSGTLYYYHPNSGRRLCGSNDYPSKASKVMARSKNW